MYFDIFNGPSAQPALAGDVASDNSSYSLLEKLNGKGAKEIDISFDGFMFAVPKRKASYRVKRIRQMSPFYQLQNKSNFVRCPSCEEPHLKLMHHLCPAKQVMAGFTGVKRIIYKIPTVVEQREAREKKEKEETMKRTEARAARAARTAAANAAEAASASKSE